MPVLLYMKALFLTLVVPEHDAVSTLKERHFNVGTFYER